MIERRMTRRYNLSLPLTVHLPNNQEPGPFDEQTRDISIRSVYFTTQTDIVPGPVIDFTLTLPGEITRGTEVSVRAQGHVVRVDKRCDEDHETIGVAVVIKQYDIVRVEGTLI